MSKRLLWCILAVALVAQAATFDGAVPPPALQPLPEQAHAARLAADVLTKYHYKAEPLDKAMSEKIFDRYLKALDGEKYFFLQSDIDRLARYRDKLGLAIAEENLAPPFAMFNLYLQRAQERFSYARGLLKGGFDFGKTESFAFERKSDPWPRSEAEMRDLWRKRVKNDWLRLKLAGKDDKSIADTLDKRYDHFLKRLVRIKSEDVFQTFMNAYTMAIEPHTNYMGPKAAEEFDIAMKLSLVGIGAVLADKDDYTVIRELVPGGPAALSGQLAVGDRIVGVAQGEAANMTDVLGWRLDDTVGLIRGAADSTVVLDILPAGAGPDGKRKLVALVRKKIALEAQSAKKSVLTVGEGDAAYRVGVITLPAFYEDFDARQKGRADYKSASRDVARLLEELKADKVDAVLMDLRNNGGGSLSEAVDVTGLFVGRGPVVQQRDAKGAVTVLSSSNRRAAWSGPLAVLINRGSASASEIFAAAIQDYGRGLVIGEPSFGKGTVQTMFDLDQWAKNARPQYGELKFTIAQFFRVNGGTTQLKGVVPDIAFPSAADPEDFGESSYDNALPWTRIPAADYAPAGDVKQLAPALLARNEVREKSDKDFLCLQEDVREVKRQREKNQVSLNEAERRKERQVREARLKGCEDDAGKGADAAAGKDATLRDDGLQPDERNLASDLAAEKARKNAKDVVLREAAHVLGDEVELQKNGGLADRGKAGTVSLGE